MKRRADCLLKGIVASLLLYGASENSHADGGQPPIPASSCVEVEVNGYRALPYDCYQQLMAPRATAPTDSVRAKFDADISRRQPNQNGLYSPSALKNRMGNNLGKSALPQRPVK